jgi:hypothetical protein
MLKPSTKITEDWIRYKVTSLPNVRDPQLNQMLKASFVSGASTMFRIMVEDIASILTQDEQKKAVNAIADEIRMLALGG